MKKITQSTPIRRWSLRGFPGTGKSTFAARMRGPQVVVDADGRFAEVVHLADGDVYAAADNPADNVEIRGIESGLTRVMPRAKAGTVIVDSVTEILNPIIAAMMMGDFEGNGQVIKAMLMRRLSSAACKWGTDVLFIYHLYEGNLKGRETVNATVSDMEQDRLMRSLNVSLETVYDDQHNRLGVKVVWSRNGRAFPDVPILWDDTGTWDGMPDAIEKAIYGNGSKPQALSFKNPQEAIEKAIYGNGSKPQALSFKNPQEAIEWAMKEGAYVHIEKAQEGYERVKAETAPQSACEMWEAWIDHCRAKIVGAQ